MIFSIMQGLTGTPYSRTDCI